MTARPMDGLTFYDNTLHIMTWDFGYHDNGHFAFYT